MAATHPTAPPNPFGRAVNYGFNPPTPTPRKRRIPIVPVLMVLLLAGVAAAAYKFVLTEDPPPKFVVQTAAFTFTLPDTPIVELLNQEPEGDPIPGTQWTLDSGNGEALLVMAMDFGVAIDQVAQQAAFDRGIAGGAAAAGGTVTSDSSTMVNGVFVRDTEIALIDGTMYMKSFAQGAWIVFLMGATTGSGPPDGFDDLVASFAFL